MPNGGRVPSTPGCPVIQIRLHAKKRVKVFRPASSFDLLPFSFYHVNAEMPMDANSLLHAPCTDS